LLVRPFFSISCGFLDGVLPSSSKNQTTKCLQFATSSMREAREEEESSSGFVPVSRHGGVLRSSKAVQERCNTKSAIPADQDHLECMQDIITVYSKLS
jgi:hypothetical protein